uniref:HAT1 n=1 Tax=Arundo donax TaxID=35708 RepID=A0A0A9BCV8_ARUDO
MDMLRFHLMKHLMEGKE